jgi:hypothetical protein
MVLQCIRLHFYPRDDLLLLRVEDDPEETACKP